MVAEFDPDSIFFQGVSPKYAELSKIHEDTFGGPLKQVAENIGSCAHHGDLVGLAFHCQCLNRLLETGKQQFDVLRCKLSETGICINEKEGE